MTTAPDLPLPIRQAPPAASAPDLEAYPAEPAHLRPSLTVVPDQLVPDQLVPGESIELDEALGKARPKLKRYAARRLHDEHEAEEVVQEALLRAFQHRHLLATEDDLMAWLTVVTGRLVIDRLRVRGRSTPVAELPPASRASRDTADVVVARDEARIALDALEAMPGRQASVLWAREVEGLSYDEIGTRFGMTEPSVRSLLHRARRTLRREYAERGGTLSAVGLVALVPWLRGLKAASRIRHAARRGASTAAVAATGLAIATVVPFGGHSAPTRIAPDMHPALRINAALSHQSHAYRHGVASSPTTPTVSHHTPAVRPDFHSLINTPRMCRAQDAAPVSAGCDVHRSPTVYVKLPIPVAGTKQVGVSKDGLLCKVVPTTALTGCDATALPSKRSSS